MTNCKKKMKVFLAFLMIAVMLSSQVFVLAEHIEDDSPIVYDNYYCDQISQGVTCNLNNGYIWNNKGTVLESTGQIVTNFAYVNNNYGWYGAEEQTTDIKYGVIDSNLGKIDKNYGTVKQNVDDNTSALTGEGEKGLIVLNGRQTPLGSTPPEGRTEQVGTVLRNMSTITKNNGVIVFNDYGTIGTNDYYGEIKKSSGGQIGINYGSVYVESETVSLDDICEISENYGNVVVGEKGVCRILNNFNCGNTVKDTPSSSSGGNIYSVLTITNNWWPVEISNTENVEYTTSGTCEKKDIFKVGVGYSGSKDYYIEHEGIQITTKGRVSIGSGTGTINSSSGSGGNTIYTIKPTSAITIKLEHAHQYDSTWDADINKHWHTCTFDGCTEKHNISNHKMTHTNKKDATYFADGNKAYDYCSICNKYFIGGEEVTKASTIIPKLVDTIKPSGAIKISDVSSSSEISTITYNTFFNTNVPLTIQSSDSQTGIKTVRYMLKQHNINTDSLVLKWDWQNYSSSVDLNMEGEFVAYAEIKDKSDNVLYINTNGFVIDKTAPVISGLTNGADYYDAVQFTVSDTYLDKVKINDVEQTAVGGKYTIPKNIGSSFTVVATDKAGNSTTVTVSVKPRPITDMKIAMAYDTNSFTYNGNPQGPSLSFMDNSVGPAYILKAGVDYTLTQNVTETEPGTSYVLKVTGVGNYSGETTFSWSIAKAPGNVEISEENLETICKTYDGLPFGTLADFTSKNKDELTLDQQITYTFYDYSTSTELTSVPVNVGDYLMKVSVPETAHYLAAESDLKKVSIQAKEIYVVLVNPDQVLTYNGATQSPELALSGLVDGESLGFTYDIFKGDNVTDPIDAGDYAAKNVLLVDSETGLTLNYIFAQADPSVDFRINPLDLNSSFIQLNPSEYLYDGKTKSPDILFINMLTTKLVSDKDYTASGTTSAIEAGNYKLTVIGTGNYTGTRSFDWKITTIPDEKKDDNKKEANKKETENNSLINTDEKYNSAWNSDNSKSENEDISSSESIIKNNDEKKNENSTSDTTNSNASKVDTNKTTDDDKTSDNSNPGLWIVLGVLVLAGIVVSPIFVSKRKKSR